MANSRLIHSDLFEDDFVGSLSFFERLLWIGLFGAVADDQGRFLDHPALVRVKVFLYDANVTDDMVEKALDKLVTAGKIIRYSAGGKRLCQIANWWKYQKPSWASESRYPAPEGWQDRVKMHVAGGKIITTGWDTQGGFREIPSGIGSEIPSGIGRRIKKDKDEVKDKDKNTTIAAAAENSAQSHDNGWIYREYEANFGALTPLIADQLDDLVNRYPRDWIRAAIGEALRNEVRRLSYVDAVLQRWKRDGFQSSRKKTSEKPADIPTEEQIERMIQDLEVT